MLFLYSKRSPVKYLIRVTLKKNKKVYRTLYISEFDFKKKFIYYSKSY